MLITPRGLAPSLDLHSGKTPKDHLCQLGGAPAYSSATADVGYGTNELQIFKDPVTGTGMHPIGPREKYSPRRRDDAIGGRAAVVRHSGASCL